MDFKIRNQTDKAAIIAYVSRLPDGKEFDVSITKHTEKRSDQQNRLLWMWIGIIAKETGNDSDTIYKVLCRMFLGVEVVEVFGRKVAKTNGTHGLSKEVMTDFLTNVESFAATELGIVLPHPEDLYYEQMTQ